MQENKNIKFWEQKYNSSEVNHKRLLNKKWTKILLYTALFVLVGFVLFVLTAAVSHVGLVDSIIFVIVWLSSYAIVYNLGERNNATMLSNIMAVIITIIALCVICNTAFNYTE